jgi:hypothetical protein
MFRATDINPYENYFNKYLTIIRTVVIKDKKVKVKVPPLWAAKFLRVGRVIALPNLRPWH